MLTFLPCNTYENLELLPYGGRFYKSRKYLIYPILFNQVSSIGYKLQGNNKIYVFNGIFVTDGFY